MAEPFGPEGLELAEARRQILSTLQPLSGPETLTLPLKVTLGAALGRVAAEPLRALAAVPGFRASIMDGYAISGDVPPQPGDSWRLVGRSAPAAPFEAPLASGDAVRILTGAPIPEGSGRVLPQELVELEGQTLRLCRPSGPNAWIRGADEEAAPGQELVPAGQRLGPADLGRLASCGVSHVSVTALPRIGLLVSGDELVPPGGRRAPGQIWESNSSLLAALLERLGYPLAALRLVSDEPMALRQGLLELAACSDVVVSSGGVSAGDSDWIRPLLAELGALHFWKLFLKPGRPFAWGELAGKPFFGLPGNPVAAAVTALQLLWPALQRLEGAEPQLLPRLLVRLQAPLRRGAGRPELARAALVVAEDGGLWARVSGSQASSRIGSLQGADLLLEIPAELGALEAGTPLWAQLLRLPVL
jgi:molybdopterin molybdotransferase